MLQYNFIAISCSVRLQFLDFYRSIISVFGFLQIVEAASLQTNEIQTENCRSNLNDCHFIFVRFEIVLQKVFFFFFLFFSVNERACRDIFNFKMNFSFFFSKDLIDIIEESNRRWGWWGWAHADRGCLASFRSTVRQTTGILTKVFNSKVNGAIMMKSPQAQEIWFNLRYVITSACYPFVKSYWIKRESWIGLFSV